MFETLVLVIKGGIIGVANIIPGVSGGTLAVILGIYDRLIECIARFFERGSDKKGYLAFIAKVFAGAAVSILLLANLMDYLLTSHYHLTMFAFMGLILGGIPAVIRQHGDMRIATSRLLSFAVGAVVVLGIALVNPDKASGPGAAALPSGAEEYLLLFVGGFLAGGAMIVPGVSGSFMLVVLGQYGVIISAIKQMAVTPLGFVALGAASGILAFSRIIEFCLKKAPANTYYFILGLIAASFYEIFPGLPKESMALAGCLAAFAAGGVLSLGLSRAKA